MGKTVERQLSIYINGKEVNNNLKSIGAEISKLRNKQKTLTAGTDEFVQTTQELKKAKTAYKEVNDEIREVENAMDDANGSAAGFIENLSGIFTSLKSGDLDGAKAGLEGVKNGIVGATRAGIAFIATPIGAAIAVLAGIALVGKEWFDFNKEVAETNGLISSFTGLTGQELDDTRIKLTALSETFDKEYLELLEAAKPIAREFNISMTEALDVVGQGMAEGGRVNEEYLDSLREYPAFFARAGFSATEFKDLINTGFDLGIYSDKLPDAIKEATLSLQEQTEPTRDALSNAFGAAFTDDVLDRINTGEITVKEALIEISKEADNSNLSIQQTAQLTADVFKGAGEDAGGAAVLFKAIGDAASGAGKELTELDQYYVQLTEANEELAQAQDNALKSDSFTAFSQQGELAWIRLKTYFFDVLDVAFQFFIDSNRFAVKTFAQLVAVFVTGKDRALDLKDAFVDTFNNIVELGGTAGEVIKSLFSFDSDQISASVDNFRASYNDLKADAKNDVNGIASSVSDAWTESGKKLDEYYAKQDAAAAQFNLDEEQKIKDAAQKEIDDKLKKEQEEVDKKAREQYQKDEEALAAFIKAKRLEVEIDKLEGIDRELAAIDSKYASEIEKAAGHADRLKEIELLKEQEKNAAKAALTQEYAAQELALDEELALMKQAAEFQREVDAAITDEEKQALAIEQAQLLAQAQLDRDLQNELAKVQNVEGSESLKQAIKDKYAQKEVDLNTTTLKAKEDLQRQEVEINKATEDAKLGAVQGALGSIAGLLNEGTTAWKALKIAEASIATFRSAQQAYSSVVGIPVVGPALAPIAAATAVAAGVVNVKKIASTKIKKIPKPSANKYYGGYTESDPLFDDEYGGATGYYHANEYVTPAWMTQSPRYANTIGYLESERRRGPSYTTDSTASTSSIDGSGNSSDMSVMVEIRDLLRAGVIAKTFIGYEEMLKMNKLNDDITRSQNNATT